MKKALIFQLLLLVCCGPKEKIIDVGQIFGPCEFNDTKFCCYSDESTFIFKFEAIDSTITLTDPATHSLEPLIWDRVEIFFSPKKSMDRYYCAEIDPNGNNMDYMTEFYRKFSYDWHFATMKTSGHITHNGYLVEGSIKRSELESLGFDLEGGFYMGIYKADIDETGAKWHSYIPTPAGEEPDFHKPGVMFKCKMTPTLITTF